MTPSDFGSGLFPDEPPEAEPDEDEGAEDAGAVAPAGTKKSRSRQRPRTDRSSRGGQPRATDPATRSGRGRASAAEDSAEVEAEAPRELAPEFDDEPAEDVAEERPRRGRGRREGADEDAREERRHRGRRRPRDEDDLERRHRGRRDEPDPDTRDERPHRGRRDEPDPDTRDERPHRGRHGPREEPDERSRRGRHHERPEPARDDLDEDDGRRRGRPRRGRRRGGRRERDESGTGLEPAGRHEGAQPLPKRHEGAQPLPKRHASAQRVGVLADLESLEEAADRQYQGLLSPIGLLEHVCGGRQTPRAIAYLGALRRGKAESLRGAGFDTLVTLQDRTERLLQLAMDAVSVASRVDALVIATADRRLAPVAAYLRSQGLRVELATFDDEDLDAESLAAGELALGPESVFTP